MKRYRLPILDFDTTSHFLAPHNPEWNETAIAEHEITRSQSIQRVAQRFGSENLDLKVQNYIDLGAKYPFVLAFHNKFLDQVRSSFITGSYYPSLTGACALGERILNHLILNLRDNFKSSDHYKKICRQSSFDNWSKAIDALEDWKILTADTSVLFRELNQKRNFAIHFNPVIDREDRQFALDAINHLQEIIQSQFSILGNLPWILHVSGDFYIKKDWESHPFVQLVYLPSGTLVGYKNSVKTVMPWVFKDTEDYPPTEISDEQFADFRNKWEQGSLE